MMGGQVLYARHADQRKLTFAAAVKSADEYIRNLRVMILRANMIRAEFMVKGESSGWSGGGASGPGGSGSGGGNSGVAGAAGAAAENAHGSSSQETRDSGAFAPRVPLRT